MDSSFFFGISTMAYILAMIIYIIYLAFRKTQIGIIATTVTIIGFVSHTVAFLIRWKEFHDLTGMSIIRSVPLSNLYESLIFFVWCLILGYLILEFRYKNRSFGAFVTPVAGLALAFIDLSGMSKEMQPLVPALQSNWLFAHVTLSLVAYAAFALSFSTGLMHLILKTDKRNQATYIFWTFTLGIFVTLLLAMGIDFLVFKVVVRPEEFIRNYMLKASLLNSSMAVKVLSWISAIVIMFTIWRYGSVLKTVIEKFNVSAETLDEITYKSIAVGFPVFTLGALIIGAIWAEQAWGAYWSWDPKETWSLITWFVYAFYLHSRMVRGWRGEKVATVAVIGFGAVLFTYLGVNLLLAGLHSYGGL